MNSTTVHFMVQCGAIGSSLGWRAQVRGGLYRILAPMTRRVEPTYMLLTEAARQALINGIDETGQVTHLHFAFASG